jgi:hypothetical protein
MSHGTEIARTSESLQYVQVMNCREVSHDRIVLEPYAAKLCCGDIELTLEDAAVFDSPTTLVHKLLRMWRYRIPRDKHDPSRRRDDVRKVNEAEQADRPPVAFGESKETVEISVD